MKCLYTLLIAAFITQSLPLPSPITVRWNTPTNPTELIVQWSEPGCVEIRNTRYNTRLHLDCADEGSVSLPLGGVDYRYYPYSDNVYVLLRDGVEVARATSGAPTFVQVLPLVVGE